MRRRGPVAAWVVVWLALLAAPLQLSEFWEQTGLFAMAAIIGAIGLTLLTGTTGQLSLAHAFFLAVGAYGYSYFAGTSTNIGGGVIVHGAGLPPFLAMVLAGLLAPAPAAPCRPLARPLRRAFPRGAALP